MTAPNIKFARGLWVHAYGYSFYPTLCRRVPSWHRDQERTSEAVTCPSCLKELKARKLVRGE